MSKELGYGDIVRNGYQSDDMNLYLIVGSTTRKTGRYSTGKYFKCWDIDEDKVTIANRTSLFDKRDNKLEKVGHLDYKSVLAEIILEKLNDR